MEEIFSGRLIDEVHPQTPINPYGRSKLMAERLLLRGAGDPDPSLAYTATTMTHAMGPRSGTTSMSVISQMRTSRRCNICPPAELPLRSIWGTGTGTSVLEIWESVQKVTGRGVPKQVSARRSGDPAVLVANASKASDVLGWVPRHSEIEKIIADARKWYQAEQRPHYLCLVLVVISGSLIAS